MIREARASVVKRAGGSIQHRLSAKFPPRSPELGSEEMQQLWTAFINSPYVNQLVTDRVPVDFVELQCSNGLGLLSTEQPYYTSIQGP